MRKTMKRGWSATALTLAVASVGLGVTMGRLPAARAGDSFAVARESRVQDRSIGEVRVNGTLVMRLRDSAHKSGVEQSEDVARRLNDIQDRGALRAVDIRVRPAGDVVLLLGRDEVIVVVDPDQARAAGTTVAGLSRTWRDNLAAAVEPRAHEVASLRRGASAPRVEPAAYQRPEEETRTKIVPILTVGSSFRAGIAQVTGPASRVDEVKAVARLDTDYKDAVRIAVLVPISTENIISNIKRVPQVSISAVGDLKL